MSALGHALDAQQMHGRDLAPDRTAAVAARSRIRLARRHWWRQRVYLVTGAVVAGAWTWSAIAASLAGPEPNVGVAPPTAEDDDAVAVGYVAAEALASTATPRSPDDEASRGQQAAVCRDWEPSASGVAIARCEAAWVASVPLISVDGTEVAVDGDGSVRVAWEIANAGAHLLPLDLGTLSLSLVLEGVDEQTPTALKDPESPTVMTVASSLWDDGARVVAVGEQRTEPILLDRTDAVAAEATWPAGTVPPHAVPHVEIQIALQHDEDAQTRVYLEGSTGALTPRDATSDILAGAALRDAETGVDEGFWALRCPPPAPFTDEVDGTDRVPDRWGGRYLWTPTCTPLTLASAPLGEVEILSYLDRDPYTRVVSWSAVNVTDAPLAVDLAATTVVMELDPPVYPREDMAWAATGAGIARIDTLWRSATERTAAQRGPDANVVVVAPGETVRGRVPFSFEGGDGRDAGDWGARLEGARAVVHIAVPAAGIGADTLVLELPQR